MKDPYSITRIGRSTGHTDIPTMNARFGIVDLFSGPGGLGEGFASVRDDRGKPLFEIDLSVEADAVAHQTLRLRSFLRKVPGGIPNEYRDWQSGLTAEPDWSALWPAEWAAAEEECQHLELGTDAAREVLTKRIPEIHARRGDATVLIGGPPCQAYSLAGRGRKAVKGFVPHPKKRHLLYQEYIEVLRMLRPAAFVMENVKGLLSSGTAEARIIDNVLEDLRQGGGSEPYIVFPLAPPEGADIRRAKPTDFLVRAEHHGVPQARHRVIIVGIRQEIAEGLDLDDLPRLAQRDAPVTVDMVLGGLAPLRSRLSARSDIKDSDEAWGGVIRRSAARIRRYAGRGLAPEKLARFHLALDEAVAAAEAPQGGDVPAPAASVGTECPADLAAWLSAGGITTPSHHEPRSHIPQDLERYLFLSASARAHGRSPKAREFPKFLAPNHESWGKGFTDRFRVQVGSLPSSTIVCHIAKDGHYFIHPDPAQVRSLTVREAARLQTFPDDYHFAGTRTQAYVQVGNAVPPFLAWQIGKALAAPLMAAFSDAPARMLQAAE